MAPEGRGAPRPAATSPKVADEPFGDRVEVVYGRRSNEPTLRTEQQIKELVRLRFARWVAVERDEASDACSRSGRSCDPSVIALWPADGHEDVRVRRERVSHEELRLAGLVPARGEAGAVFSLNPQPAPWELQRGAGDRLAPAVSVGGRV
jgi:hypothetical protein